MGSTACFVNYRLSKYAEDQWCRSESLEKLISDIIYIPNAMYNILLQISQLSAWWRIKQYKTD